MSVHLSEVLRMVDGKPGHLLHFCSGCGCGHVIDIHAVSRDGKIVGFDGDFERPSVGEPLRFVNAGGMVCEYMLRAGVQHFTESCTAHGLAGKARPLVEFPTTCQPENPLVCMATNCPQRKTR